MAETVGTLDIAKILADAQAQADAAAKAKAAAKAASDANKARTAEERKIKFVAKVRSDKAEGLETIIQEDLMVIKGIAKAIADQGGKVNQTQLRDLKYYTARYNKSIAAQQTALTEANDILAGKYDVDNKTGAITLKAGVKPTPTPTPTPTPPQTPKAGEQAVQSPSAGQTPAAVKAQTPKVETVVKPDGTKVVSNTPSVVQNQAQTGGNKYTGLGTTEKPYLKNGSPFTGVANGKTYENGIIKVATNSATGLTKEQEAQLGTYGSKFLIQYFKTAENGKYNSIYTQLVNFAKQNATPDKVEAFLRDTPWYKDVNQRTYAVIGASALANGITLDSATRDSYRDQILGKVKTADEVAYDIRMKSIDQYQLQTTKPEIAKLMMAGVNFADAAKDYISTYTSSLELAGSQFDIADKNFQALFKSATSLGDFDKKVKRTDQYLSLPKVQAAIKQNTLMVQQKYRQYGLNLTAEAAANLGKNAYLGDTSTEQIDENLRQEAIKLFPAFKDRILNGESPLSIASPYIGAVSRILELPEGSLDLENETIRKAMMGKTTTTGDKTTSTVTPLWEFEQSLYKDSRWQYTANARQKLDGITLDVMSRFGVIG